jgi:hypothetical protein
MTTDPRDDHRTQHLGSDLRPRQVGPALFAIAALVAGFGLLVTLTDGADSDPSTRSTMEKSVTSVTGGLAGTVPLFELRTVEKTAYGSLDFEEPTILDDGTTITTLVESPDVGLLEIGVTVAGPSAAQIRRGEFSVVTSSGRLFTPSDLIVDGISLVFTINAAVEAGETFAVIWARDSVAIAVLR